MALTFEQKVGISAFINQERKPNQMHQYWSLAAAAALVYAVSCKAAAKQQRAEAASIQTAFIQPLPASLSPKTRGQK